MALIIGLVLGALIIMLAQEPWANRKERRHCPDCLKPHHVLPKYVQRCDVCSKIKRADDLKARAERERKHSEWVKWYKYSRRQYRIRTEIRAFIQSNNILNTIEPREDVQTLSGREFEFHMAWVLKGLMFRNVKVTKQSNDKGIDIKAVDSENRKVIFELKRWKDSQNVSSADVRKFIGAITESNADKGYFITTSDFTKEAKAIKGVNRLELWRYDDFINHFQSSYDNYQYYSSCANPNCNSQVTHSLKEKFAQCSDCGEKCEGELHLTQDRLSQIISLGDENSDVENLLNFIHYYYCIECSSPMIDSDLGVDGDFGVTADIDKQYEYLDNNNSYNNPYRINWLPDAFMNFTGMVCSNDKCSFHQIPMYDRPNDISKLDKVLSMRGETSIQQSYERAIKAEKKEEEDRLWEMNKTVLVFDEKSPIIRVQKERFTEGYAIESEGIRYFIPEGIQIETLNRTECERLIAFVKEERMKVRQRNLRVKSKKRKRED